MRAKTLLELMTLTTNLYMISKDQQLLNRISEMSARGKEKFEDLMGDFEGEDAQKLGEKLMQKAKEAKEELDQKIGELVEKLYDKMNIAHTEQVNLLKSEIESLKRELALSEARIVNLEARK